MSISLKIETRWFKEIGDGSNCLVCKDRAWLCMYQLYFRVEDNEEWSPIADIILCQSCGEVDAE